MSWLEYFIYIIMQLLLLRKCKESRGWDSILFVCFFLPVCRSLSYIYSGKPLQLWSLWTFRVEDILCVLGVERWRLPDASQCFGVWGLIWWEEAWRLCTGWFKGVSDIFFVSYVLNEIHSQPYLPRVFYVSVHLCTMLGYFYFTKYVIFINWRNHKQFKNCWNNCTKNIVLYTLSAAVWFCGTFRNCSWEMSLFIIPHPNGEI